MRPNLYRSAAGVSACGAERSAGAGVPRGLEWPRAGHSGPEVSILACSRMSPGAGERGVRSVWSGQIFAVSEPGRETEKLEI